VTNEPQLFALCVDAVPPTADNQFDILNVILLIRCFPGGRLDGNET
jgi:hypothetical protein